MFYLFNYLKCFMEYSYSYPQNPIPRQFLTKRHVYVRSILRSGKILDLGCNRYKIVTCAISLDIDADVKPDVVGSCLNLPFPKDSFDVVTALELIEHFCSQDQGVFLNEIHRVLKQNGQFIVSTPNINESTRKLHDFLFYVSHSIYAQKDVYAHIGELNHSQLKHKLLNHRFKIVSDKAFSIFNYVVGCEKLGS